LPERIIAWALAAAVVVILAVVVLKLVDHV
jgi:hypothetical protein